jgi:hypothetical protein
MGMRLDKQTKTALHIAFRIYDQGKDGQFWLDKANEWWVLRHGEAPVPHEVWVEVMSILASEYPNLWKRAVRRLARLPIPFI